MKNYEHVDSGTLGGSKAAHRIMEILAEHGHKHTRSVTSTYHSYCENLNEIQFYVKNPKTREFLVQLVFEHYRKVICSRDYPEIVRSYLDNIFITKHKQMLRVCRFKRKLEAIKKPSFPRSNQLA